MIENSFLFIVFTGLRKETFFISKYDKKFYEKEIINWELSYDKN